MSSFAQITAFAMRFASMILRLLSGRANQNRIRSCETNSILDMKGVCITQLQKKTAPFGTLVTSLKSAIRLHMAAALHASKTSNTQAFEIA